jgi:hypothetical protein
MNNNNQGRPEFTISPGYRAVFTTYQVYGPSADDDQESGDILSPTSSLPGCPGNPSGTDRRVTFIRRSNETDIWVADDDVELPQESNAANQDQQSDQTPQHSTSILRPIRPVAQPQSQNPDSGSSTDGRVTDSAQVQGHSSVQVTSESSSGPLVADTCSCEECHGKCSCMNGGGACPCGNESDKDE